MTTASDLYTLALQHHAAGNVQQAEQLLLQLLQTYPQHADTHHILGIIAYQTGRHAQALRSIGEAIRLAPRASNFHSNLGLVYVALDLDEVAVASFRQALVLQPDLVEAHANLANIWLRQGKLEEAAAHFRLAVRLRPAFAEAHFGLGAVRAQQGHPDEAAMFFREALKHRPDLPEAHNNLGNIYLEHGKLEEAAACFRHAIGLRPDFPEAQNNLGIVLGRQGHLDAALAHHGEALRLQPDFAAAHWHLGNALNRQGRLDDAIAHYREALRCQPDMAIVHMILGIALHQCGRWQDSLIHLQEACRLEPTSSEAQTNLGITLMDIGRLDEAEACHRKALEINPQSAQACNNLGAVHERQGKLNEALHSYRRAVDCDPGSPSAYANVGAVLRNMGKLDEAIAWYRHAIRFLPNCSEIHGSLLYALLFCPGYDAEAIHDEHCLWDRLHGRPLAKFMVPHANDRGPERRLRVGYVSADFRDHVVGRNLLPLFREHDHLQFEVICYANVFHPDGLTRRFQDSADVWRSIVGLSDDQLAQLVREDGIDILVDLTLHMSNSRLLAFARKPAPVQVTFAGYPGTTGLSAMDYRLTDPYLDPPGLGDGHYCEESIRLADSFWCYEPPNDGPAVNRLPALENGFVTFGCLNNFCKINGPVIELWAEVLKSIDQSRLVVLADEGAQRQHVLKLLEEHGIPAERVGFVGHRPYERYLEFYHGIDIGLDTFPYNGHTTSLDSLWMGVPVITLIGQTVVGRAGLCQLQNLGMPELIAQTPEQFVETAVKLAGDLPQVQTMRATLRVRMRQSPLMDARRFTGSIEDAFRAMWKRWCGA